MGGTGFTAVVREGCLYSSSTGGVWMITRALNNVWASQDVQDALSVEITGMFTFGNYVGVATRTGGPMSVVVFDTVLGAWLVWHLQADNALSTTLVAASGGRMVWADNGRAFEQTPSVYLDTVIGGGTSYVPMSGFVQFVHIGGVRTWKRTWAIQAEGETYDACAFEIGLSYNDVPAVIDTYPRELAAAGLLEEEVRPSKQLASSVGITFSETLGATSPASGQGIALESFTFYVGMEKGLKKGVRRVRKAA
jgi:hypothetical protein